MRGEVRPRRLQEDNNLPMCHLVTDLTFKKGTRYGCGEELSSWYNLLVKSSASIFASCCGIITEEGKDKPKTQGSAIR